MKVKLGDVCTIQSGGTPSRTKPDYWENGQIPWVKISDIKSKYVDKTEECITKLGLKNSSAKIFPSGTILYTIFATLGETCVLNIDATTNQAIAGIAIKDNNIISDYLYYYLLSRKNSVQTMGRGVAQNNINLKMLKDFEIPLPPLDEQRRIAAVLDKVSDLIAKRREQLDKLDELVKAKFVEMFGDPVSNPKGWDIICLSELGECKNGMNYHTDDSGIEIHCLGVGDFKNLSSINDTAKLPVIALNEMPSKDYLLENGDIVFVRSNGNKALVGRSIIVYPDDIPTTFSGFCIRFRIKNSIIVPQYLLSVLKTANMRNQMTGRGANIQNLNQKVLSNLQIPVPPLSFQRRFIDFIAQTDKSKLTIQQSLDTMETLKKALMQEYFG